MGRPAHKKTGEMSRIVRVMAQYGAPQSDIAAEIGINVDTLAKYYSLEYAEGRVQADTVIRKTLFDMATKEKNVACLLFLCKTRLGMRETARTEIVSPDGSLSAPAVTIDMSSVDEKKLAKLARAAFRGQSND